MEAITCDVEGVTSSVLLSPEHSAVTLATASCALVWFSNALVLNLGSRTVTIARFEHFRHCTVTKVEKRLALWVSLDVCLGAGPSGKVDTNKRKEARTLEHNGGCLMQKQPQNFIYIVLFLHQTASILFQGSPSFCLYRVIKKMQQILTKQLCERMVYGCGLVCVFIYFLFYFILDHSNNWYDLGYTDFLLLRKLSCSCRLWSQNFKGLSHSFFAAQ